MKKIIIILIVFSISFSFLLPAFASAAPSLKDAFKANDPSNDPLSKIADTAGYKITGAEGQLNVYVALIIQTVLSLLGVLFMILMIYGGFLWMTDQGNTTQVDKAKKLLTAAIIGLVIVLLSYAISVFVFEQISTQTLKSVSVSVK